MTKQRHLLVRMGGPAFCGKQGCGMIRTEASEKLECEGVESAGMVLLRSVGQKTG
jgi:hypothetical protein